MFFIAIYRLFCRCVTNISILLKYLFSQLFHRTCISIFSIHAHYDEAIIMIIMNIYGILILLYYFEINMINALYSCKP